MIFKKGLMALALLSSMCASENPFAVETNLQKIEKEESDLISNLNKEKDSLSEQNEEFEVAAPISAPVVQKVETPKLIEPTLQMESEKKIEAEAIKPVEEADKKIKTIDKHGDTAQEPKETNQSATKSLVEQIKINLQQPNETNLSIANQKKPGAAPAVLPDTQKTKTPQQAETEPKEAPDANKDSVEVIEKKIEEVDKQIKIAEEKIEEAKNDISIKQADTSDSVEADTREGFEMEAPANNNKTLKDEIENAAEVVDSPQQSAQPNEKSTTLDQQVKKIRSKELEDAIRSMQ